MYPGKTVTAVAALLVLSGCSEPPHTLTGPAPMKIGERVFVLVGPLEFPNKTNRGYINNPALVVTDKGVAVIDPGSSAEVGRMVLAKLKTVSDQPVVAVFNTHVHGDHWLANGVIKQAYPQAVIYAHAKMKERATSEGAEWVQRFDRLTEGTMAGTTPVAPDLAVSDGETIKIGNVSFRIHHTGKAHTDGDIMIELPAQRAIFTGDIVNHHAVRRMDDGSFPGNIAAIERVLATGAEHVVPGHGMPGSLSMAKAYRDYFATLYATVRAHYGEGLPDFEIKPKVLEALARYKTWDAFDQEIGRQISLAYLEAEREAF